MDERTRRTRFEERVRIEREFLRPINQRFGRKIPLAGMTSTALTSWEERALQHYEAPVIKRLANILREAAKRAEILADNSREVFAPSKNVSPDGLASLSSMLQNELESLASERPLDAR